jgi:hypothetical protein
MVLNNPRIGEVRMNGFVSKAAGGLLLIGALAAFPALAQAPAAAASAPAPSRFTASADGQEVTDTSTNLIWRRCAEGAKWDGKTCTGKSTKFSLATAKKLAADTAKADAKAWRVPDKDELLGLVVKAKKGPQIDLTGFPGTASASFGALRPGFDDNLNGWTVSFRTGRVLGYTGQAKFYLRLVRKAG